MVITMLTVKKPPRGDFYGNYDEGDGDHEDDDDDDDDDYDDANLSFPYFEHLQSSKAGRNVHPTLP